MTTVLIYRTELLAPSETFVLAQATELKRYKPLFAGLQGVRPSLTLPSEPVLVSKGSSVTASFRKKLYRAFGFAPGFYEDVKRTNPAMVHAHFAPDGAAAVPLAKRLGIPLLVTLHGFDVTVRDEEHAKTLLGKLFLQRRRRLWQEAALFLCVSNFIRDKAMASGYPADKLRTHYIGIDRSLFAPLTGGHDSRTVLFVGRLVEKKGCDYLIRAMSHVQEVVPGAELVIAGDGPLAAALRSLANTLKVRCRFLGVQSPAEIQLLLAHAAVFCVPSITAPGGDSEGLGMVFLEAQAMGVPVVSFRHGGIPEAVVDGESALLAQEGNAAELAANLIHYLSDGSLCRSAGEKGRLHVAAHFDLQTQTASLEGIYDEVLSTHC